MKLQRGDRGVEHRRGRSPYGERGLKSDARDDRWDLAGRSPYGERGLKLLFITPVIVLGDVALLTESVD